MLTLTAVSSGATETRRLRCAYRFIVTACGSRSRNGRFVEVRAGLQMEVETGRTGDGPRGGDVHVPYVV